MTDHSLEDEPDQGHGERGSAPGEPGGAAGEPSPEPAPPDFPPPPTTGDPQVDAALGRAMGSRHASGTEQAEAMAAVHEELRQLLDGHRAP